MLHEAESGHLTFVPWEERHPQGDGHCSHRAWRRGSEEDHRQIAEHLAEAHLDPEQAHIVVANHTSYLDGFIVTAALDISIHFIVKGELARILPARLLLQRFGVEFVDRFNSNKAASDVNRITRKSEAGQTIVFFPEGTFTTFPGLQPFRMGAFVTAVRTRVPVTPVAIRGARNIIRGNNWFPRRGPIDVSVRPPITPSGEGWQVALDLRDEARVEIASYCGEPDLVDTGSNEPKSSH